MRSWSVRFIALLTAAMGVINVVSGVTPSLHDRARILADWSPLIVRRGSHLAAALSGFALLLLAVNLWRRKRAAWVLTLVVLGISGLSHLLKGLDFEEAGIAATLAILLFVERRHFHARSDRPSLQQGLLVLFGAMVFTLAYGVTGFWLLDRHFSVNFGFWAAVRQTVIMFTQLYDPGLEPVTGFGHWFADSLYTVSILTTGYALTRVVRPVLVREPASAAERARAARIIEAHGRSSLARLTVMDDKSCFFSPGGSVIAFVVKGRVAVALGDPIGPEEDLGAAVAGYLERCSRNDWRPAFYQTMPRNLPYYEAAGLEAVCIGHEAIVDLARFTLEGHENKALRGAVNRLTRLGARAEYREPPHDDRLLEELRDVSDEWLETVHGSEKQFSLGWFDDDYIRMSAVMTVVGADGKIRAFANLMPEYRLNETTVDLMRQRLDAESGTMDFLFVELFRWARARGYDTFNLGLCAFARVGEEPGDPAVERAFHFIYEHVNQFYSFKGLHEYKEKFHPEWSPRYLVLPSLAALPAVAIALILADSGASALWPWRRPAPAAKPAAARAMEPSGAD